jgi:hypothetical protein
MCQAILKSGNTGDKSLSLNMLLQDEPLVLYVDGQGGLSLRLCDGQMVTLGQSRGGQDLLQQNEITIESFVGGFLAAGYRVGVRSMN